MGIARLIKRKRRESENIKEKKARKYCRKFMKRVTNFTIFELKSRPFVE